MTVATLSADGRRLSAAVWARWEEEQERRDGDSLAGTLLALYGYDLADLVGALEAGQVDKARTLTRDLHDDAVRFERDSDRAGLEGGREIGYEARGLEARVQLYLSRRLVAGVTADVTANVTAERRAACQ